MAYRLQTDQVERSWATLKIEVVFAPKTVLVSVDKHGAGYYKVLRVSKIKIKALCENGNEVLCYPNMFSHKIIYSVAAFECEEK